MRMTVLQLAVRTAVYRIVPRVSKNNHMYRTVLRIAEKYPI